MKTDTSKREFNFDTKILRYLLGIVEEGSLSKAAEKFYISQPALSRYLKNVEDALNVQLFTHTNNHLEPTDAGKVFLNGARSIIYVEENALREITNTHHRKHRLEIWTEEFFLSVLEQTVCPLFQQACPDISLKITSSTADAIQQNLMNGTADFGLFWGDEMESPFFTCECLFHSDIVFCAPSSEGPATPVLSGQLSSWIQPDTKFLLSSKNTYSRHIQEQILEEQGIHAPQIGGEVSLAFLTELLRSGYGNTLLPRLLASACISDDRIFPIFPLHTSYVLLGEYQGHASSEATVLFRQLILEHITENSSFI